MEILSFTLVPIFIIAFYIYRKDSAQPEPVSNLIKAVIAGVVSTILVLVLWSIIDVPYFDCSTIGGALGNAFFSAGWPEEMAKLFMLWVLLRRLKEYDEPFDGIVYAGCLGLGFAMLENFLYLIEADYTGELRQVGTMRAIFSIPGHFGFGVLMGYYYSLVHFNIGKNSSWNMVMTLLAPVAAHTFYDACLMYEDDTVSGIGFVAFFTFYIYMFFHLRKRINKFRLQNAPDNFINEYTDLK